MTARNAVRKSSGPPSKSDFYVNLLIEEWGLKSQSAKFQREVKRVLMELHPEIHLFLRNHPKLQVEISKGGPEGVWAYFPVHSRRWVARRFKLKPTTRVLLVLTSQMFDERTRKRTGFDATHHLRDHLGHTLLYLRQPKARNHCADAMREWKQNLALT